MSIEYFAQLAPDPDGGFLVTFPDVPEAITHGADAAEARANASEALGLALRGYVLEGKPLPPVKARSLKKLVRIAPDAQDVLKIATIEAFQASGMTKVALAELMGKKEGEVRRILDPDHPTKLGAMQHALRLLGKEIVIDVRDAA